MSRTSSSRHHPEQSSSDSDEGKSKKKFKVFREAVRSSKGLYTDIVREDRQAGLVTETSKSKGPERVAWQCQQSLKEALNYIARINQGVDKTDQLVQTPLGNRSSLPSATTFIKTATVFKKDHYKMRIDPESQFLIKPPVVDPCAEHVTLPTSFRVDATWFSNVEEFSRRAAIYASISEAIYGSVLRELVPSEDISKVLREQIDLAADAAQMAITASAAASANCMLQRRDMVLDQMRLSDTLVKRARTAPFLGHYLMGPNTQEFDDQYVKLKDQQSLHRGLTSNFRPAASSSYRRRPATESSVFDRLGSTTSSKDKRTPRSQKGNQSFRGDQRDSSRQSGSGNSSRRGDGRPASRGGSQRGGGGRGRRGGGRGASSAASTKRQ